MWNSFDSREKGRKIHCYGLKAELSDNFTANKSADSPPQLLNKPEHLKTASKADITLQQRVITN